MKESAVWRLNSQEGRRWEYKLQMNIRKRGIMEEERRDEEEEQEGEAEDQQRRGRASSGHEVFFMLSSSNTAKTNNCYANFKWNF
jgi:hypothetical protein